MVLRFSPWGANIDMSLVLAVCLELRSFYCFCFVIFHVVAFSKIFKTESFSAVIVGGRDVDASVILKLFLKCTYSSQRRFFITSFICLEEALNSYDV